MQSSINVARTIPSYFYTCPKHFQEEVRKIFYKNWLHIGRLDQLEMKGDYISGKIYRQPYVAVRSDDNKLNAFDNVCRHHATTLTMAGNGNLNEHCFICPYHGWTYNLDGRLIRATRLKGIQDFRAKDYGLKSLSIRTLGPLIFLHIGQNSNSNSDKFVNLEMDLDKLSYVTSKVYDLNCNWKVFVDNYLDGGYHVEYAHKNLASNLNLKSYDIKVFDRHAIQSCSSGFSKKQTPSGNRVGDVSTFAWIYPNLMLNRYGKWLDTNTVYPIDTEKCRVIFNYYIEKDAVNDAQLKEDLEESHKVQLEDEMLCERVQEGMHSQYFDKGRYAPNVETAMYHFHHLLLKDLDMKVDGC